MNQTIAAMPALTRLAEDEVIFRDSVYEFADKEIRPLAREMDEHAKFNPGLLKKLFEMGLLSVEVPESYGGAGGTFFHSVLAVESLSRVDPSVGVLVDVQNTLVINAVMRWGTEEIKRKYLPKFATNMIGAYCLSEAGSGSDAFAMATRATEKGDGYAINGRKLWITNGNEADMFIVFANVNPDAGYRGITAFIVDRAAHQGRGVEPVHGRPAVVAVTDVARDTRAPGQLGEGRDEAVVAGPVHRRREADEHAVHVLRGQGDDLLLGGAACVQGGVGQVRLGAGRAVVGEAEQSGGDHQRAAGAGQGRGEDVNGGAVHPGRLGHLAEVVGVAEVDDAVDVRGRGPQRAGILERAAGDAGAERGHHPGRAVGADEPDDVVAGGEQFGDDGGSDPARRPGHEYAHGDLQGRCHDVSSP